MRRLSAMLWLEGYAVLLAVVQQLHGVRTDEAKYLLNIPYPHPPLARWFLSLFDGFILQDVAVRILLATLMVQAVWIVLDMGRALQRSGKIAACILWLGSAAFLMQAGTVMMAPLTALQTLLFLWILSLPQERLPQKSTIGFLWLATLFTALQGVLLAPLALAALRLRGATWRQTAWYVGVPLALLALYALGNPLVLASMLIQSGKDASDTLVFRAEGLLWILVLAGSGVGAFIGTLGLLLKKHVWILASFVLVLAYVFLGRFDYYAILFLPFYITGAKHLFRRMPHLAIPTSIGIVACTIALLFQSDMWFYRADAATVVFAELSSGDFRGTALIVGSHGHEWQYHHSDDFRVVPYAVSLLPEAQVVICMNECILLDPLEWSDRDWGDVTVWFRHQ